MYLWETFYNVGASLKEQERERERVEITFLWDVTCAVKCPGEFSMQRNGKNVIERHRSTVAYIYL